MPKALISTLSPISGGVPRMAGFIADVLKERGIDSSFAYYQPYSLSPELSVPFHRLAANNVSKKCSRFHGSPAHAFGAWLPELEFIHYWPTKCWRALIDQHDFHLSVSGNCLAATPYAMNAVPFWSWVATDWAEDRVQRAGEFSWYRKILDRLITTRCAGRLEKKILASGGTIVALSEHTKKMLSSLLSKPALIGVLPMGIDTDRFNISGVSATQAPTIGFVGRLDDPRKNIGLLLRAIAQCHKSNVNIAAILVGEGGQQDLRRRIDAYGLGDVVTILNYTQNDDVPKVLSRMDVFVIPSHQEGLCIAGLEAMSCGVPVISTRCGGPEEFVIDNVTGYLVDTAHEPIAEAIMRVVADPHLRETLGANARQLVHDRYSVQHVKKLFWSSFSQTFQHLLGRNSFR